RPAGVVDQAAVGLTVAVRVEVLAGQDAGVPPLPAVHATITVGVERDRGEHAALVRLHAVRPAVVVGVDLLARGQGVAVERDPRLGPAVLPGQLHLLYPPRRVVVLPAVDAAVRVRVDLREVGARRSVVVVDLLGPTVAVVVVLD